MRIRLWLALLLLVLVVFAPLFSRWYTDWLWFGEVGYLGIFWIPFIGRLTVAVFAGGILFVLFWLNLRPILRRLDLGSIIVLDPRRRPSRPLLSAWQTRWVVLGVAAGVAGLAGLVASSEWLLFQQFLHGHAFGTTDPLYGRDVGFFVFQLPLYRAVVSWLISWFVVLLLLVGAAYYLNYGALMVRGIWTVPEQVRRHLSLLGAILLALQAWSFWLEAYELEYSTRGAIFGATYADVHAALPVLRVLLVFFGLSAVLLLMSVRVRVMRLAVGVLGLSILVWAVGLGIYPRLVQSFQVAPAELTVEAPFLRNGITATLAAFGLENVREEQFAAGTLTPEILSRNGITIENIRLWDYRPLLSVYRQLQGLRLYYSFADVDIDRYDIGGVQRQVMLAPRELELSQLSPETRSWVNDHLIYTHGFGLVMNPVNRVSEEGMPEFFIKDIPPQTVPGLPVTEPRIYFGERTTHYVVVNTRVPELDYPKGEENVSTIYRGKAGIQLTPLRRLAFAYRFGHPALVLSSSLTNESRILFARQILTRVRRLAPFLEYDRDPYLVLVDGRLVWILDAYTTTDRYPYATPQSGINYIRNAVKVVVDAYDGTTDFYIVDPTDPIAATLAEIFPGLFKPKSALPAPLVGHLRYPVDILKLQASVYATFHMRDPRAFYVREDAWGIPRELYANQPVRVEPYYVTLRLRNEAKPEFMLILPFSPANRENENMVAWMAARSDPLHYGELLVYRFPKDRNVFGPMQIESRIDQDPGISAQLTLWNQQGSQVIRGNLLVIPMEDALLYVEPLFLQAARSQLPELKRVIVATGTQIAMDETLERAIAKLVGKAPPSVPTRQQPTTPAVPTSVRELVSRAREVYRRAQERLRAGDLAGYAREIERLGEILQQLERAQGGTP